MYMCVCVCVWGEGCGWAGGYGRKEGLGKWTAQVLSDLGCSSSPDKGNNNNCRSGSRSGEQSSEDLVLHGTKASGLRGAKQIQSCA